MKSGLLSPFVLVLLLMILVPDWYCGCRGNSVIAVEATMAVTVISHQHFWSLADPFFCWPTPDLGSIYRDFGPSELRPHLEAGM